MSSAVESINNNYNITYPIKYTLKIKMDGDMPDYCVEHYMKFNGRINGAIAVIPVLI